MCERPSIWQLFLVDRFFLLALTLITIHQTLIASSAYFLTRTIEEIQQDGQYSLYLTAFLGSMILPFFPGCLSLFALQKWTNSSHQKLVSSLIAKAERKVHLYTNKTLRENFESALSRNSFGAVAGFTHVLHDSTSLLLNSLLSVIVIGHLLPAEIATGYVTSFILSLILIWHFGGVVAKASSHMEAAFSAYGSTLAKAWGNVCIGNQHNRKIWELERSRTGRAYYRSATRLSAIQQAGNLCIGLASLLPTAYLVYQAGTSSSSNPAILAAIAVNLTRLFHLLNSLSTVIYQLLEWSSIRSRLTYILFDPAGSADPHHDTIGRVSKQISVNGRPLNSPASLLALLRSSESGRFILRGENGSGKTSLLLSLKAELGERALLLPANDAGLSWQSQVQSLSTGQQIAKILKEVEGSSGELRHLLLDEWDANLDSRNIEEIDAVLASLSQSLIVVESRHRASMGPVDPIQPAMCND